MFRVPKIKIVITIVIIMVIIVSAYKIYDLWQDQKFLSTLTGKVVFARRDAQGVLNIWKINANGTGEEMLYHNEDPVNPNSSHPKWSEDGDKIYFTAMKEGKRETFRINRNGGNVNIAKEKPKLLNPKSKNVNLIIKQGSVFWKDKEGNLHQVYRFPFHNYKLNPGASEASWGPNKKYIIFQSCSIFGCKIVIAERDGTKVAALTKGREPDWK